MPSYPVRRKLPAAYSTEIGRIVTRWAWLEWELKRIAYAVLEIGPKEGRLSTRDDRADKYMVMIEDLMRVRKVTMSDELKRQLPPLKKALTHHTDLRNALVHGIWIKRPETKLPVLQVVSGDLFKKAQFPQLSDKAKIEPRALAIELPALRAMVRDTERFIQFAKALRREIEAQRQG